MKPDVLYVEGTTVPFDVLSDHRQGVIGPGAAPDEGILVLGHDRLVGGGIPPLQAPAENTISIHGQLVKDLVDVIALAGGPVAGRPRPCGGRGRARGSCTSR